MDQTKKSQFNRIDFILVLFIRQPLCFKSHTNIELLILSRLDEFSKR
jgi:hypothetical protein